MEPAVTMRVDPNQHDRFLLRQRNLLVDFNSSYAFALLDEDGKESEPFCFVQEAWTNKEQINFYADESHSVHYMRVGARQAFNPATRYDVRATGGDKIGEFQKAIGKSLLRSTYMLYDAAGNEIASATEKSVLVSLLRRTLLSFLPSAFVFKRDGAVVGVHKRGWQVRDTYTIDMTPDLGRTIDRRLILAIAVALDLLQDR